MEVVEKKQASGRVFTLAEYFKENQSSIHFLPDNKKGVIINGAMITIGSSEWEDIAKTRLYQDILFGGALKIINYNNK